MREERESPEPRLFVIGHAHIDPVWIWDWREGMREVLATFAAAADRLETRPDLFFTASSAAYYAWTEELDPPLFERIRSLVAAGRWSIVGGQWIEPDCTLPSGESVVRQLLYSQRYFEAAFGRRATIAYNIDSFGHTPSLPQLFRKAGLVAYVMMRPQPHEKDLPPAIFLWEGVDGTRLPTYRIPFAYNTGGGGGDAYDAAFEATVVAKHAPQLLAAARADGRPRMFFLGVSDHGGGPTTAGLRAVDEMAAVAGHDVVFSTPDAYFATAAAATGSLPVVRGDLHLHAVGCYSAVAWIKAANARAEEGLVVAEKLAAAAAWHTGRSLGLESELRKAWQRVLFNQFHDTLGGTCTEQAFESVASFYGEALSVAEEVTTRATQILAMRTDTWVEGADSVERARSLSPFAGHFPLPVVIFNPLSWQVRTPVALPHPASRAFLEGGAPVPLQEISSGEATRYDRHSLVLVDLPPLGHQVVWLREPNAAEDLEAPPSARDASDNAQATTAAVRATTAGLQNDLLTVDLDRTAGVISAIRPTSGRAVIQPEGIRPVVLDDPSDTWSHGVVRYEGEERACDLVDAQVVESGPVRALWRLTYRWDASTIDIDVALHQGLGYVDLVVRSDWRQRRQLLKLVVPLAVEEPRVTVGVPYGAVERDHYPGEEVIHHWLDVSSAGGGVTCAADVTYGYDLAEGRLRLTVLRSPLYADHGRPWADDRFGPPVTDQGLHVASYRLIPHSGRGQAAARRMADEHGTRFPIVAETWHTGPLGSSGSVLDVSPDNVAVSALKRAESGQGWVVRLREIDGGPAKADLRIPPLNRIWAGRLGRYELLTLLIPDEASRPIRAVDLAEFDLPTEQGPDRR